MQSILITISKIVSSCASALFAFYFFGMTIFLTCGIAHATTSEATSRQDIAPATEGCCHPELINILNARMRELDKRAEELDRRERELNLLKSDIEEKIAVLNDLQKKLQGPVEQALEEREKNFKHLVGVYGKMDPAQAAILLDRMKEDEVARILSAMKSKQVAAIFANMNPDKAAKISAMISQ